MGVESWELRLEDSCGDANAIAIAEAAVSAAENELSRYDQVRALCRNVTKTAKTGSLISAYEAYCMENGFPHGITVQAGDRVDIVFARVNNPHITAFPTVSYTKITDQSPLTVDYAGITGQGSVLSSETDLNWPRTHRNEDVAANTVGSYVLDVDFTDGWSAIGYHDSTVETLLFNSAYNTYGDWSKGILWLDDCGISRTAADGITQNFQNYGVGFAYTVPYSGTIQLDAAFTIPEASASEAIYFSVLRVNETGATVVYPASDKTGDHIADAASEGAGIRYLTSGAKHERADSISVTAGDQLVFVWRDASIMEFTAYQNRDFANKITLTVCYEKKLSGSTSRSVHALMVLVSTYACIF